MSEWGENGQGSAPPRELTWKKPLLFSSPGKAKNVLVAIIHQRPVFAQAEYAPFHAMPFHGEAPVWPDPSATSNTIISTKRKSKYDCGRQWSFPELKKEKAALLKEQGRLNTERKALKESMQEMLEAYRAIDEQVRQTQRQRQRENQQRRDAFGL